MALYGRAMLIDSIVIQFATATGFLAAAIAVGGFMAHVRPAITGAPDSILRRRTAIGGLGGLVWALLVIAGSAALW